MKLLLVCTSGGHFSTMMSLEPFWSCHERVWVSDLKADTGVLNGVERVYWLPYQAPRNLLALVLNIPETIRIIRLERPDLVISTGASIALNFALISKLLGLQFTYVESISRHKNLSLSGRLVYLICNEFYVQWPNLCKKYRKASFKGYAS